MKNKFCVFCGKKPEKKSREHVLPQWLIELTGLPNRVVRLGTDYDKNKDISFAWSQLVAPACTVCNSNYSELENKAKPLIEKTLKREAIRAKDWIVLFNWFDKVRIGLWLTYHLIQKNPTKLTPKYFINDRVNKKDRMLCIYPIQTDKAGLTIFGVDTLLFHRNPSSFALRINDMVIINMSTDSLFLGRCGFPFPKIREINLERENALMTSDYAFKQRIKHPIIRRSIIKPSIQLYQPIIQTDIYGNYPKVNDSTDYLQSEFIKKHTIPEEEGHGIIFRQQTDKVMPIYNKNTLVKFNSINKKQARPLYEILPQVLDLQIYCHTLNGIYCEDKDAISYHIKCDKAIVALNKLQKSRYRKAHNLQN